MTSLDNINSISNGLPFNIHFKIIISFIYKVKEIITGKPVFFSTMRYGNFRNYFYVFLFMRLDWGPEVGVIIFQYFLTSFDFWSNSHFPYKITYLNCTQCHFVYVQELHYWTRSCNPRPSSVWQMLLWAIQFFKETKDCPSISTPYHTFLDNVQDSR